MVAQASNGCPVFLYGVLLNFLGLESSISWNIRNILRVVFLFSFFEHFEIFSFLIRET